MINQSHYDGASFINQCPVQSGQRFTYKFIVDEIPGTYLWHAHTGTAAVDGLNGPLIVRPPRGNPTPLISTPNGVNIDGERILFIRDWYQNLAGIMTAPLNRPFYANADWTPNDGNFTWVGNPQSILVNGKGVFQDCTPPPVGSVAGTNATCLVSSLDGNVVTTDALASASSSPSSSECTHAQFEVEAGKTYVFRILNGGHLLYQTVCFEGHNVTLIAADAIPITPLAAPSNNCIDINSGQRYDVLVTANATAGTYWISSQSQFRPGAPSGFAVLRYINNPNPNEEEVSSPELPPTPVPQPGSQDIWPPEFDSQITMNPLFLEANSPAKQDSVYSVATTPVPAPTAFLMVNISQPVLNETGQIRWALNNIVNIENPPCNDLQSVIKSNPSWLTTNAKLTATGATNATLAGLNQQIGPGSPAAVFLANLTSVTDMVLNPTVGSHIAPLELGQVVEVVLQNNAAASFNGNGNRTAQEQHPFHLHGHHFWYLGSGTGTYPGKAAAAASLNTINPPLRDTATLYPNTWLVFRFIANNPGTWLFHCHISFHLGMGQSMVFAEEPEKISPAPAGMPECPSPCLYSTAPWNISYTDEQFKNYMPPSAAPAPAEAPSASSGTAAITSSCVSVVAIAVLYFLMRNI
jgi:L-ascorbate oxidase